MTRTGPRTSALRALRWLPAALLAGAAVPALAVPLAIDEATYPGANGDYNNLLFPVSPKPTVVFTLLDGTNTYAGGIYTPPDQGDTFVIELGSQATLTSASINFATNANDFNPLVINQNTRMVIEESSVTPTVLELHLTGPGTFSSSPIFSLGAGIYSVTILSEVLGLNNGGPVNYLVSLQVTAVPEPGTWALMLAGIGVMGVVIGRRRRAAAPA